MISDCIAEMAICNKNQGWKFIGNAKKILAELLALSYVSAVTIDIAQSFPTFIYVNLLANCHFRVSCQPSRTLDGKSKPRSQLVHPPYASYPSSVTIAPKALPSSFQRTSRHHSRRTASRLSNIPPSGIFHFLSDSYSFCRARNNRDRFLHAVLASPSRQWKSSDTSGTDQDFGILTLPHLIDGRSSCFPSFLSDRIKMKLRRSSIFRAEYVPFRCFGEIHRANYILNVRFIVINSSN